MCSTHHVAGGFSSRSFACKVVVRYFLLSHQCAPSAMTVREPWGTGWTPQNSVLLHAGGMLVWILSAHKHYLCLAVSLWPWSVSIECLQCSKGPWVYGKLWLWILKAGNHIFYKEEKSHWDILKSFSFHLLEMTRNSAKKSICQKYTWKIDPCLSMPVIGVGSSALLWNSGAGVAPSMAVPASVSSLCHLLPGVGPLENCWNTVITYLW